jgi:ABC-type antimicrobial peptide transport system permease subunit
VLANNVARRHREIGVRMAVGAQASDIARLVLTEGAETLAVGVAIGAAISALISRLLAGLLYGVAPGDPTSFGVVAAGLPALGLLACTIPSIRASRLDPLKALRST